MRVIYRPDFYTDAQSAADWYDGERSGLGIELLDELNRSVTRLIAAPESIALVDPDIRVCRLQRFPYPLWHRFSRIGIGNRHYGHPPPASGRRGVAIQEVVLRFPARQPRTVPSIGTLP
jgi:hypothetical protein